MKRYMMLAGALALAAACGSGSTPEPMSRIDAELAQARSKRAKDSLIVAKDLLLQEKERQLTLQSQLIGDAATSARLVSEIASDLARARVEVKEEPAKPESAIQNASDELRLVQKKVRVVLDRLSASESRIRRMRTDSATAARLTATQASTLAEYEASIAELRATVTAQTAEIAMLAATVDSMTRTNLALQDENRTITAKHLALQAHDDSVFVAIGTEKELTERGIIRREGGTLLAFGRGKTIVPARSLAPDDFTVLSRSQDMTIQLPEADHAYRIVSRQSLEFTDVANPKDALVTGSLTVTDPGKFWEPSKFLILVRR